MTKKRTRYGSKIQPKKRAKTMATGMARRVYRSSNYTPRRPTSNAAAFAGAGFPLRLTVKHKFNYTYDTGIANTLLSTNINCIGMYQPDNTTPLTKQPMFFDQLTPLYSRYTVIGSRCTWTIVPADTTAEAPVKWVAWINENNTGGITDFDALSEYRGAQTRYSQGGLNPDRITIKQKWSTRKHNPGSVMANNELSGTAANNPLESPRFQLNYRRFDNLTTLVRFYISVKVTYVAVWHELREINSS